MSSLPKGFEDLEPLVEKWGVPTEKERNWARVDSKIEELDDVYNTVFPRIDAMLEYLNERELDNYSEDEKRLLFLSFSLAEIAPSVELFRSPTVPDGFDSKRFLRVHIPHQTPEISPA
ncbi:MAG: hypothetical protein KUG56_05770 [Kordiimonadaceae bacterium]|nr:hypothetical protein [Kordiimonadaceae bacterium]